MELPHIGQHCSLKICSKLDFLPFTCDACKRTFCEEHYSYTGHSCTESYAKNVLVPQCPLCDCPIPVKKGEDPNIKVNEHMSRDCEVPKKKKVFNQRCSFNGCKKKELIEMRCNRCHLNFCIQHRLEMDHKCEIPTTKYTSVFGGTQKSSSSVQKRSTTNHTTSTRASGSRQPKATYLSQSGAELNRVRQARLEALQTQKQSSRPTQPAPLSEDEAMALAIAQSLQETRPSSYQHSKGSSSSSHRPAPPTAPPCSEDEALAKAIEASLQDQELQIKRKSRSLLHAKA